MTSASDKGQPDDFSTAGQMEKHEDNRGSDQELGKILDVAAVQSLMEDVTKLTGMGTAILDLKGTVLVATGWQDICTKFHRANAETERFCMESDLYLAKNIKPGEYVAYKCKNGLWDMVTPLFISGKHVGNIYTGQFFYEDDLPDVRDFEAQAKRYGFDKEAYIKALLRVQHISRDRARSMMDFLVKFSKMISSLSYGNLQLVKTVKKNERIEEELRRAKADLESKVAERTSELRDANELLSQELVERRQAEQRERQLQQYLRMQIERMPIGLIIWDRDFRVTSWNPAATGIFGYTEEEALGKHPYDFIVPKEAQPAVDDIWTRLLRGDMTAYSVNENITKDSRTIICNWTNTPLRDANGSARSVLSMVQDITERTRAEKELRKLSEELEQRVKERTIELEAKNRELERMNKNFVGRELRMVELKKKIKELTAKARGEERNKSDAT